MSLSHIYTWNLAVESAKAVVYVTSSDGAGTGFMIAQDLLMTCNNVIGSREKAEQSEYTFNYQLDITGKECIPQTLQALPGGIFFTNPELDYTVVTLKDVADFGKPLILKSKQLKVKEELAIIQHPSGSFKKMSMHSKVAYADNKVVQYTRSTQPGSAGSPVFDEHFEVVAIHHSGGMLLEPITGERYLRSEGTSMIAVLKDLQANAPEIYAKLQLIYS